MNDVTPVAAIVGTASEISESQTPQRLNLFGEDGAPLKASQFPYAVVSTTTAIGTAAKLTSSAEPPANTLVPIKFVNGNSANSPTVAFNGGTPRVIQLGGVASTGAKLTVAANGVVVFFFDGTILHQLGTVA